MCVFKIKYPFRHSNMEVLLDCQVNSLYRYYQSLPLGGTGQNHSGSTLQQINFIDDLTRSTSQLRYCRLNTSKSCCQSSNVKWLFVSHQRLYPTAKEVHRRIKIQRPICYLYEFKTFRPILLHLV